MKSRYIGGTFVSCLMFNLNLDGEKTLEKLRIILT